jgi:hypothetical protein
MQDEKRKQLDALTNKNLGSAKRTTIILEKKEREYIDSLIREGKEPGIKPLISKMLSVYRNLMIYDWRFPGEYYCGISRVALVNVELLNILNQQIPRDKLREIGRKMGNALKVSLETTIGLRTGERETWQSVFERLKVQGFGDFSLKDKYILLKAPFISDAEIWQGILEDLLEIELDIKNSEAPMIFQIKTKLPSQ